MVRCHSFSQALVLTTISIAVSVTGGQLASMVKLPIFLDSIGILINTALLGPVIGILTGLLTNLLWGLLIDPIAAAFAPIAMVIDLVTGQLARAGWFCTLSEVAVSGVIIALAVAAVVIPLRTVLFGGVAESRADLLAARTYSMEQNPVELVAITVIGADLVDKVFTVVIVWLLLRQLPIYAMRHFPATTAVCQVYPFIFLTLWALAVCTTPILSTQTMLSVYSAATFFHPIVLRATRWRTKHIVWLMFSLGVKSQSVYGGRLTGWLSGVPCSPERWTHAIMLWSWILVIVSTSQSWVQHVPVQCFICALFVSRLPPGVAYLFVRPLLVVEQLKRQLAIIYEIQRTYDVSLDKG